MYKIFRKTLKILVLLMIVTFICISKEYLLVSAAGGTTNTNVDETISNININDEFDDKSVIVVLKSSRSQYYGICPEFASKLYSIEEVKSHDDLSELSVDSLANNGINTQYYSSIENYLNSIDFKQILKINLNTNSKQDVIDIIKVIENFDEVLYVGPNYVYKSCDIVVNDTYYDEQWALTGTYGIDIDDAWNFTTGSSDVRVGIIDSGIANHLDLNNNVVTGKDFYNNNDVTTDDIGGHGTSVAGIIGAIANNGRGIVGINKNVSLVPLQTASDTSGNGLHYYSDIIEAIEYARDTWDIDDKRIPIINCSIGGFGYTTDVLAAVETYQGLFIWSAGNNGENLDSITGIEEFSLENLISVGAHDQYGQRSIWNSTQSSSYGEIVDIYAPSVCYTTHSYTNNSYRTFGGTSCAAPHVTGVAALLLSMNENLKVTQLKNAIINSAENINITIPDDSTQNVKKLNAYNAVKYVLKNYGSSTTLKFNTKSLSKSVDSTSTFFNEKNYFLKMNVENAYEYDFAISSSSSLEVTLYDSNFKEINVSQTSTNGGLTKTFSYYLSVGTYYLQSNYVSSTASGTINVSIVGEPHTHSYTMQYYNYKWHKLTCECGQTTGSTQVHTILQSEIVNGRYAECIGCHHLLDLNSDMALVGGINSASVTQVSINGSYILPSGIIVLVDDDLDAYLNGTLVFYDKDKVPVLQ